MREITLKELRDTHPVTTASMVEVLEAFVTDCEFGEHENACDCVDCTGSELIDNLGVRIK